MLNNPFLAIIVSVSENAIARMHVVEAYAANMGRLGMNVMGNGAGSSRTQDRRFARTEKAIVEAFLRLAEERDLSKITVTALAREADIDRKTFYLHYGTVDAVADALLKQEAERIVEVLREESFFERGTVDTTEFFSRLSVTIAPDLARTRRMAKHVSVDTVLSKIEGPLTEALIEDDWLGLAHMGPYLGYCVSFYTAGLLAIYRRWLLVDSEIPLEDISSVANAAAFYGIKGILGEGQAAAREAVGGSAQEGQ